MDFKGTKGEWECYNYKGKGACIDIIIRGQDINSSPLIAQVYSLIEMDYKTPQNNEMIANAKLIASAPELLDALQEIVDCAYLSDYAEEDGVLEKAKKAIKKALGE